MTNKKGTKHALLMSALALLLCVSMLVGSTYAWFTDSVVSKNNIIKSGTLDVEMMWKDAASTGKQTTYKDASEGAIFNSDKWEPGYVEAKNIKITNIGTLALKYQLSILANGEVSELADVIDVYYADGEKTLTNRDLTQQGLTLLGKLTDVLAAMSSTASGNLLSGDEHIVTLALKMQESADNKYQDKSIGSDFEVKLLATQLMSEDDSFDDKYDAGAPWFGATDTAWYDADPTATEFTLYTAEELAGLAKLVNLGTDSFQGKTVKLASNVDLNNVAWTPIGTSTNKFNGTFIGAGCTVYNLKVSGISGVGLFGYTWTSAHIEGITIDGATVYGNDYIGAVVGTGYMAPNCLLDCTVKNAEIVATPYLKADGVTYDGGAKAGAVAGYLSNANIKGNKAINCSVTAYRDLGGIVGMVSAENRDIEVVGNTVEGVTMNYVGAAPYDSNTPNQNMTTIVGRVGGNYTVTVQEDNESIVGATPEYAAVTTKEGVISALKAGATTIDALGADIGNLNYALGTSALKIEEGTEVTIKNAIVSSRSYGNMVNGTVIFENCKFTAGLYSIHFSDDNGTATGTGVVIFKNCDLVGWNSFGTGLKAVRMYDCTLVDNGTYGIIRSYVDLYMEKCSVDVTGANFEDGYYDGVQTVSGATLTMVNCTEAVANASGLSNALANGGDVVLTEDIADAPVATKAPYGNYYGIAQNGGVLDGNGKTLDFDLGEFNNGKVDNYGIMTSGGTIKNAIITGVFRGIMIMNPTEDLYIDNVTIGDEDVCYAINTGEGDGTHSLYVTNSTIKGWSSYGTAIKDLYFTNCTFAQGEYYTNVFGRLVKPYVDTVFDSCEFNSKFYIDLSQLGKDGDGNVLTSDTKIVLKNCTVNGVKLTAENWKDLIVSEDDCGDGQISIEAKDGSYMSASNILDYVVIQ